jgi:hypothetical protein
MQSGCQLIKGLELISAASLSEYSVIKNQKLGILEKLFMVKKER